MSQEFLSQVKLEGGDAVVRAFSKFTSEVQKNLVETLADRQLGQVAQAMRAEVLSLRTRTDEPYTRKGSGRRWPYIKRGVEIWPGTARQKVASSIAVIPLGSKQRRLFVGKRLGVTGRSGSFYARLIERGFKLRAGKWVKKDIQIPGKWPLYRLFKRMKPGVEAEVVREFTDFVERWTGAVGRKSSSGDMS